MSQGTPTAAGAGEEVVPASDYRAFESQVHELQRLLGKKTMENEILREAVSRAAGPKNCCCARPRCLRLAGERGRRSRRRLAPALVGDAASPGTTTSRTPAAARRRARRPDPSYPFCSTHRWSRSFRIAARPAGRGSNGPADFASTSLAVISKISAAVSPPRARISSTVSTTDCHRMDRPSLTRSLRGSIARWMPSTKREITSSFLVMCVNSTSFAPISRCSSFVASTAILRR